MHGNRDFLIGERFAARVGATLLPDPSVVELDGQRLLLMHGDSLCTRDEEYQTFRTLARSSDWQESVLKESLARRREMAKGLREVSRDAGSRKAADIMDVTEREVIKVMQNAHCRILIHGHTHRPARHEDRSGVRWVLGDWDKTGWYIELHSGDIQLVEFNINQ
jgi:UDP-2,3-diacylglucosamine hydrolase